MNELNKACNLAITLYTSTLGLIATKDSSSPDFKISNLYKVDNYFIAEITQQDGVKEFVKTYPKRNICDFITEVKVTNIHNLEKVEVPSNYSRWRKLWDVD